MGTTETEINEMVDLFMTGQYDEVVWKLRELRPDLSEGELMNEFMLSTVKFFAKAYGEEMETAKRLREEVADQTKQIHELTDAFPSASEIVSRAEVLRDKLIERIREEAAKYPGDVDSTPCGDDEQSCLFKHIHEFVSVDDEIKIVVGSPERIAAVALQFILPLLAEPK